MGDIKCKSPIPGKIVEELTVPAREYLTLTIKKGQILRLIDAEGQQVADVLFFNSHDLDEVSSCTCTTILNSTTRITRGHVIFSQKCNKMLTIIEDTVGMNAFNGGYCTEAMNYARYKIRGTRNCGDNFALALAPHGLTRKDFHPDCCCVFFMNLAAGPDGSWQILEPVSKPGDHIDLRAEMECLIALSNCPQERNPCNAFNPTPLKIVVYENS